MQQMNNFKKNEDGPGWRAGSKEFAAPLDATTSGRLVFSSGAANVTLRADPSLPDLAHGYFTRHIPEVRSQGGTMTIHYRRFPFLDWLVYGRDPLAQITLNASIPWEIEFAEGLSRLNGDLSELQLCSLDVLGGASRVALLLARPVGAAFIYVAGGASNVSIRRPPGVGLRLQVQGGAANLAFDEQRFGAVGGETRLESPGFDSATAYYDICIAGGASNLTIDRYEGDVM